jgi:predicted RNA-binding Zn ribbon-like protein
MHADSERSNDWIDGFLFISNRPILDFLNTKPVLEGVPTELLTDGRALERWLIASGMMGSAKDEATLREWRNSSELKRFLQELIEFREKLRKAVLQIESGAQSSEAFIPELNRLLRQYPRQTSLLKRDGKLVRETYYELRNPADLWAPIVHETADLLADTESSRIRKCETCVIHFFDTSKKGSRRWCSMNICGNKLKVAAYQRRKRAAGTS